MLSALLSDSLPLLTLSARDHARLNAAMTDSIRDVMLAEDWTCHVCATRLPEMMEVDHVGGHTLAGAGSLLPICQFCHDRAHPLWAAARGRLVPVLAPDYAPEDLSALSWMTLLHECHTDSGKLRTSMSKDWKARHDQAADMLGHHSAEAVFEAVLALRDKREKDELADRLKTIDAHIRFAPVVLLHPGQTPLAWTRSGFFPPAKDWAELSVPEPDVPYARLRQAGDALLGEVDG